MGELIDKIFILSSAVRYVAVYMNGELLTRSKVGIGGASAAESDRYEELLVNPAVLLLTRQRGNIDCGGLEYVLIRYGNFFQFVTEQRWGHVSVCIEADADPLVVGSGVLRLLESNQ